MTTSTPTSTPTTTATIPIVATTAHAHTTRCWWDLHQARWTCPGGRS